MEESEMLERESNPAAPDVDENDAPTLGDLVAEMVAELGADRAMLWGGYAVIGGGAIGVSPLPLSALDICRSARGLSRPSEIGIAADHAGEPLNSASLCEQSARPHLAQLGIRSR